MKILYLLEKKLKLKFPKVLLFAPNGDKDSGATQIEFNGLC